MSIIDDLKAEAAKLLAEAEKVEKEVVAAVSLTPAPEPTPAPVAAPAPAPAPKPVAKPAAKETGGKTVCGVKYAADGLTIEWKER
jgi:hypothetical protein